MDIFDEADKILQSAQKVQKLERIIEVQRHIIIQHEQVFMSLFECEKLMMEALLGSNNTLTPEQEAIIKPLHFAPMRFESLSDQLQAAHEELKALEGE